MLRRACDLGRRMANRLNSWKLMSELPSTSIMSTILSAVDASMGTPRPARDSCSSFTVIFPLPSLSSDLHLKHKNPSH